MTAQDEAIKRLYLLLQEAVKRLPGRQLTVTLNQWDERLDRLKRGGSLRPDDLKIITGKNPENPNLITFRVMLQGDFEKETADKRPGRVFEL